MPSSVRFWIVACAILASALIAQPADAQPIPTPVGLSEWTLTPREITAVLGSEVRIWLFNNGNQSHNFFIERYANYDPLISHGRQANVSFVADALGTFAMYCAVADHRQLGMEGTFVVSRTPPDQPGDPPGDPSVQPDYTAAAVALIAISAFAAVVLVIVLRRRRPGA